MTHINKTRVQSQFDSMKPPVSTLKLRSRKPFRDTLIRRVNFVANLLCNEGHFCEAERTVWVTGPANSRTADLHALTHSHQTFCPRTGQTHASHTREAAGPAAGPAVTPGRASKGTFHPRRLPEASPGGTQRSAPQPRARTTASARFWKISPWLLSMKALRALTKAGSPP